MNLLVKPFGYVGRGSGGVPISSIIVLYYDYDRQERWGNISRPSWTIYSTTRRVGYPTADLAWHQTRSSFLKRRDLFSKKTEIFTITIIWSILDPSLKYSTRHSLEKKKWRWRVPRRANKTIQSCTSTPPKISKVAKREILFQKTCFSLNYLPFTPDQNKNKNLPFTPGLELDFVFHLKPDQIQGHRELKLEPLTLKNRRRRAE